MKKRFIISVVALLLYMGMIFWVSSLPNEQLTPEQDLLGIIIPQSIKHVVEYAVLGVLMSRVVAQVSSRNLSTVLYSSTFSACYGILDEIHQHFVPTRCCTLLDMCINAVGGTMGVLLYVAVARCCVHDYRETQS